MVVDELTVNSAVLLLFYVWVSHTNIKSQVPGATLSTWECSMRSLFSGSLQNIRVWMLHRCVSVSSLSLLGRRGRSRGVVQAGYEEGCSGISSPAWAAWIHWKQSVSWLSSSNLDLFVDLFSSGRVKLEGCGGVEGLGATWEEYTWGPNLPLHRNSAD